MHFLHTFSIEKNLDSTRVMYTLVYLIYIFSQISFKIYKMFDLKLVQREPKLAPVSQLKPIRSKVEQTWANLSQHKRSGAVDRLSGAGLSRRTPGMYSYIFIYNLYVYIFYFKFFEYFSKNVNVYTFSYFLFIYRFYFFQLFVISYFWISII